MMWILVATLIVVVRRASADCGDLYEIPAPEIVVFTTGGFRISIGEKSGITEFRFNGNVNEEIQPLRPGIINMETQHKIKGKWVLENQNINLKLGDYICYWIFVKKGRLGYVRQPQFYHVIELVPYFEVPAASPTFPSSNPGTSENSWNRPMPADNGSACKNCTETLATLQNQVKSLVKTVELLKDVLKRNPDANKLTLNGKILQEEDPTAIVRFILWDKLDFKPNVVSALRNNDGSITFEVQTLEEKIEILKMAQEKLVDSKVTIS